MDILIRWIHIATACIAVGGLIYARWVVFPVLARLSDDARKILQEELAQKLRPIALTVIVLLTLSGAYNLYVNLMRGVDTAYHMAFGFKFLLALHVFAMLFLISLPPSDDPRRAAKRPRLMLGGAIAGLVVLALGAYLRTLHS